MSQTSPEQANPIKRSKTLSTILSTVLFMVVVALVVAFDFEKIKTFISQAGAWGIALSIVVYALLGMTLVPSEPLTLLLGAMFGPWIALLASGIGNTLAAIVEYYVGRRIGSATNLMEQKEKLPFGLGKLRIDSPLFLIGGRMIPGYGSKVVSFLAGIYHVPLYRYVWTTIIPIFAGSIVFAFGGFGLKTIFH